MNNKKVGTFRGVLVVLLVIALLMLIPPIVRGVINGVGSLLGWTDEKKNSVVQSINNKVEAIKFIALGLLIGVIATSFFAVPVVAFVVGAIALASLGWGVFNWVRPTGQKPDNVYLGEKL